MFPILWENEFIVIHSYGVFISLAIFLAVIVYRFLSHKDGKNLTFIDYLNLAVLIYIGFLGSKFLYFIKHEARPESSLNEVLQFWEGGLSSIGGIIFVMVYLYVIKKYTSIITTKDLDRLSLSFFIGLSVGKIGCFLKGCCYGRVTESIIGITFPAKPYGAAPIGIPLVPIQLIESFGYLVIFLILLFLWHRLKDKMVGLIFSLGLILFSGFRFVVEFFRYETFIISYLGLTWVQIACLFLFVLGLYFYRRFKTSDVPSNFLRIL